MNNLPENSKYYKLFHYLLYKENEKNKNNFININSFNEKKNNYINNNKPIKIEHYKQKDDLIEKINGKKDKDADIGINYNATFTRSKSNDHKSYSHEFNFGINDKNVISRNPTVSSAKKLMNLNQNDLNYYKKFFNNKEIFNNLYNKKNKNFSFIHDDNATRLFYNFNRTNDNINFLTKTKHIKRAKHKNDFNIILAPKNKKNILNNKNTAFIHDKKTIHNSTTSNEIIKENFYIDKLSKNPKYEYIFKKDKFSYKRNKNKNFFKKELVNKQFNDMSQRNRFNKMKKELSEETIKINNMISDFFKNPLYNIFNKKRIALDKQKYYYSRPKSALS